ncbi:hypothetical protein GCM10028803_25070 [Larkinella knui]|uniref:Uncharacterized protein n=1 Tax=Larkinella knui TaxID=2025310 RepID=A0A3P1CXG1_9BACT|nr:hypothetical protein [Larkinella knui]RRB17564.1 hypothetical protein EHT87_04570 [Larkinella knui]
MAPKQGTFKHQALYWSLFSLLLVISGFLALGSGYMAYQLTRESSITVGSAGIGFYVMYYLGSSFLLVRSK